MESKLTNYWLEKRAKRLEYTLDVDFIGFDHDDDNDFEYIIVKDVCSIIISDDDNLMVDVASLAGPGLEAL